MISCELKTIQQLISTEQAIQQFMGFFREYFPEAAVPIKMHVLEDNATPWANLNHVGCGLLGEQGAESIHAKFTRLGLAYTAVTDKVQHLLCIVKEHLKSIAPQVVAGCSMCFERVDLQCLTGGTTELKSATKAMFGLGTKPR